MKFLVLFLIAMNAQAAKLTANSIEGYWLTKGSGAVIQIFPSKSVKGQFEGKLVWLKKLHTKEKKQILDDKNPDEKFHKRSLLGLKNLEGFVFDGDDVWKKGTIYDPKKGKTYSAKMYMDEGKENDLELRGYVGIPLFGRSSNWRRQKGPRPDDIKAAIADKSED